MTRSVAQERAADFFITQMDKVVVGMPNEQSNVLYVLLDQHIAKSEAGEEIARFMIDPAGYVLWATFEQGHGDEFDALYNDYVAAVGILHRTEYPQPAPDSSSVND